MLIFQIFVHKQFPLNFFNVNPFQDQQALLFGVLNYEKQHEEGTCKVSGRSVVFSAFYADFCLCPKLVPPKNSLGHDQIRFTAQQRSFVEHVFLKI